MTQPETSYSDHPARTPEYEQLQAWFIERFLRKLNGDELLELYALVFRSAASVASLALVDKS